MKLFSMQCKKEEIEGMSSEECSKTIHTTRSKGMGLIVAGIGCFAGLAGGLSSTLGVGSAIAIGIGASCGIIATGVMTLKKVKEMEAIAAAATTTTTNEATNV